MIWVKRKANYFCEEDWTGQIRLKALQKIAPSRTSTGSVPGTIAPTLLCIPDSRRTSRDGRKDHSGLCVSQNT